MKDEDFQKSAMKTVCKRTAELTGVDYWVVRDVLAAFRGACLEHLLKYHYINVAGITRVYSKPNKRLTFKRKSLSRSYYATLNRDIRDAIRLQENTFHDSPGIINALTWKGAVDWSRENREEVTKRQEEVFERHAHEIPSIDDTTERFNNFDDDEEFTDIDNPFLNDDETEELNDPEIDNPFLND